MIEFPTLEQTRDVLPELAFQHAPDFELALGEYGSAFHGLIQPSRRPLSTLSQASTLPDDSDLLDPPHPGTRSHSRSFSNGTGSGSVDAQPGKRRANPALCGAHRTKLQLLL